MSKTTNETQPETTMIRVSVPSGLHSAVRAAGAYRRKKWPRIIEEALTAWLAQNKPRTISADGGGR